MSTLVLEEAVGGDWMVGQDRGEVWAILYDGTLEQCTAWMVEQAGYAGQSVPGQGGIRHAVLASAGSRGSNLIEWATLCRQAFVRPRAQVTSAPVECTRCLAELERQDG